MNPLPGVPPVWALALVCGSVCGSALFAGASRELTGRAVDLQTGAPISHARVTVRIFQPGNQPIEATLLTDGAGAFSLWNVPEGSYQISGEKAGYLRNDGSGTIQQQGSLTSDGKPAPVILPLTPQGVIEGSVVDEKGRAAPSVTVHLLRWIVVEGLGRYQSAASAQTDETGSFRIFDLAAGRYCAVATGHMMPGSRTRRLAYPEAFYPHAADVNSAQPIELKPGQEQAIRIGLPEPIPAREVRGQVVNAGQYLSVQLRREPTAIYPWSPDFNYFVDPKTQTFRISGVTPGVYTLEATAQVENSQRRASTTLTVGDADVTGIRLEFAPPAGLSGTLRVDGQGQPVHPAISLRSPHFQFATQVDGDGSFKFSDLPVDTYRVVIQAGTAYVRSVRQGARDVLRDGLVIADGTPQEPVEIVLGAHGASIEGTVAFPGSSQTSSAVVALFCRAGGEMVLERQVFANRSLPARTLLISGLPAIQGGARFTMQGVAPGDCVLYAWPSDAQIEYANPAFMRQYDSFGKSVTVTGDAKVTVGIDRLLPRTDW